MKVVTKNSNPVLLLVYRFANAHWRIILARFLKKNKNKTFHKLHFKLVHASMRMPNALNINLWV